MPSSSATEEAAFKAWVREGDKAVAETLTVTVREWDERFEMSADEFMAEMSARLAAVPEQDRSKVTIEFRPGYDSYGDACGSLSLFYERRETDEEKKARTEEEKQRLVRIFQEHELKERAAYERLKAKYGQEQIVATAEQQIVATMAAETAMKSVG